MSGEESWLAFERRHVWHPYASMQNPAPVYPVKRAEGVELEFEDGRRVIDGMASWWSAIHGYNVPELNEAIERQLKDMSHVMFGGLTHGPAANLARRLLEIAPQNMNHLFFSDSGSVSVEVAMKMALQYWQARGRPEKQRLLTIRSGYHGDTFGAMSVCDPVSGMHHLFAGVLAKQLFADAPTARSDDQWDDSQIASLKSRIKTHHHELAAVILEPIVQGAGGMRMYAPEFLRQVRVLCDEYDLLLIVDEIATGFGRTGTMFACEQAAIEPDIMCIGKALTGGYMSLAATLCSAEVCEGIHADGSGVLMHGPTFMANPLACAVALASLELLLASPWQQRVAAIEAQLEEELSPCRSLSSVADLRIKGAIGVIEMKSAVDVTRVQELLIDQGVWLRPFGKLIYTMPPYVISPGQLSRVTAAMRSVCATA
ncbi:adenosylmethionine-8-amino-7-oxononanoate aminotransferase [Mariprofundus aestuarium]|uniref:Adenosylmethionine-8-amino-7-oxononanoate aminotransferase n=1 Tax=Mariprofundus aestuarium TaxID=1921086 RepID=A0A2K8L6S5_MARES|nr:adenosylmethionine-8-amino-7-oxononanoate aminotransferase [Mariprofundus aestuarium]